MIVSTEGMEASGKSRLALSAPRPVLYQDFDMGLEGVQGAPDGPEPDFIYKTYHLSGVGAVGMDEARVRSQARSVIRDFIADYIAGLGKVRTIVVDTMTAAWAGQRIARSEDKYVEMEEEFRSLIRSAYEQQQTNVILIHHLRQDWGRDGTKSYKKATWSRDGMDSIANMVQLAIRQRYVPPTMAGKTVVVPGGFEIDVLKARDNIGLVGQTLPGLAFAELCGIVCPTIDWSK